MIVPAAAALFTTTDEEGMSCAFAPMVIVPLTLKFTDGVIVPFAFVILRLLKLVVELPLIFCVAVPFNVIVLVDGVYVPELLQSPLNKCVNVEPLNVVPLPIEIFPIVNAPPAVAVAVPEVENVPAMDNAEAGIVFVPLPDNVRFPYNTLVTVCAPP